MAKRLLLTGGGTAGHVMPNIALIPALRQVGYEIEYLGWIKGIENQLMSAMDIPFHGIVAGKLRRYFSWRNYVDVFYVLLGFIQAVIVLYRRRPDLVFSKGGFVAPPVIWAAWCLRIPVIIHESDITLGLANKLSLAFAQKVCFSFPETAAYLPAAKAQLTGVPVRQDLLNGVAKRGREILAFANDKPVLLIMGGSLGANLINQVTCQALVKLLKHFQVVHICGAGNTTSMAISGYRQFEYVAEDLPHFFAISDVVVSRAGATTLFELLTLHKPHLLIPLSTKASRGDQIRNAQSFAKRGYSQILTEQQLNPQSLVDSVCQLYQQRDLYQNRLASADIDSAVLAVLKVIKDQLCH